MPDSAILATPSHKSPTTAALVRRPHKRRRLAADAPRATPPTQTFARFMDLPEDAKARVCEQAGWMTAGRLMCALKGPAGDFARMPDVWRRWHDDAWPSRPVPCGMPFDEAFVRHLRALQQPLSILVDDSASMTCRAGGRSPWGYCREAVAHLRHSYTSLGLGWRAARTPLEGLHFYGRSSLAEAGKRLFDCGATGSTTPLLRQLTDYAHEREVMSRQSERPEAHTLLVLTDGDFLPAGAGDAQWYEFEDSPVEPMLQATFLLGASQGRREHHSAILLAVLAQESSRVARKVRWFADLVNKDLPDFVQVRCFDWRRAPAPDLLRDFILDRPQPRCGLGTNRPAQRSS